MPPDATQYDRAFFPSSGHGVAFYDGGFRAEAIAGGAFFCKVLALNLGVLLCAFATRKGHLKKAVDIGNVTPNF